MKKCKKITEGTCKECSACGNECKYYETEEDENYFGYGYTMWGGKIRDTLSNGARYYMNHR